MSRRATFGALGIVVVLGAIGIAIAVFDRTEPPRRVDRAQRDAERAARLREESEQLIPDMLEGLYLGMPLIEARRARNRMHARSSIGQPQEERMIHFEENFPNGARAVYVFEQPGQQRLQRIQILSLLPSMDAIAPHLLAMNEQYGSPTGIWNCPDTGGVPTRRFTWRHGQTTVSDVFLVYGERVSVTLYIAPSEAIDGSLRMARCTPIRDRAQIERFPVATQDQMMGSRPAPN